MPGQAPKDAATRRRRNKSTTRSTLRAARTRPDDELPALPKRPKRAKWAAEVVTWWERAWRSMPRTVAEVDISGLELIADLRQLYADRKVADVVDSTELKQLAGEIRLQERRFGLDEMARRTLQWELPQQLDDDEQRTAAPAAMPEPGDDPRQVLRVVK